MAKVSGLEKLGFNLLRRARFGTKAHIKTPSGIIAFRRTGKGVDYSVRAHAGASTRQLKAEVKALSTSMLKAGLLGGALLGGAAVAAASRGQGPLAAEMLTASGGAIAAGIGTSNMLRAGTLFINNRRQGPIYYFPKKLTLAVNRRIPKFIKEEGRREGMFIPNLARKLSKRFKSRKR